MNKKLFRCFQSMYLCTECTTSHIANHSPFTFKFHFYSYFGCWWNQMLIKSKIYNVCMEKRKLLYQFIWLLSWFASGCTYTYTSVLVVSYSELFELTSSLCGRVACPLGSSRHRLFPHEVVWKCLPIFDIQISTFN